MKTYRVTIRGLSEYLQNRFIDPTRLKKVKKQVIGKDPTDDGIPFEHKAYKDDEGNYYLPKEHLKGALTEAGKNFKGSARRSLTYVVAAMFRATHGELHYEDFVCDERIGKNPNTKGNTVLIKRPKFVGWKAIFDLSVEEDGIEENIVKQIIEYAGRYVGIGDFRPMKKGEFGRFEVTQFVLIGESN